MSCRPLATSCCALLVLALTCTSAIAQETPPTTQSSLAERLSQGRRLLQSGAHVRAEQIFRAIIEQDPNNAVAQNELGVALFQQGAYKAATVPFRAAVKLDAKLSHAWANLAEAQRLSRDFKRAALSYHRFLQLEKGDRYGVYGLALCFEGYEQFDKALRTLQVAEKASQKDPQLLARINIAVRRVRRLMAEARLPLLERGDAQLMAGRWDDALRMYERGLTETEGDAVLLGRRGIVKAILGDLAAARADLEAALLADPSSAVTRAAYALVLDAQGLVDTPPEAGSGPAMLRADRAAAAFRAFSQVLAAGEDRVASAGRGEAALRLGQVEDALQDFGTAGDAAGTAEIHVLRGDPNAAREAADSIAAGAPPALEDLPVWRRTLLQAR